MSKVQAQSTYRPDRHWHRTSIISEVVVARYIHELAERARRERSAPRFAATRPAPAS